MSLNADLGSISSTLSDLSNRITTTIDTVSGTLNEDITSALLEVERSLKTAERRLDRILVELR